MSKAKAKRVVEETENPISASSLTTDQIWARYTFLRDHGHNDYVRRAEECTDYYFNKQWNDEDLNYLNSVGRPAITINKILSVISNLQGSQVFNRTDVVFKPRNNGADEAVANALSKVYMQVSDNNDLTWTRSDVFTDGIVTSRGFFDARISYEDNIHGEVRIKHLNPKNVLVDSDASSYSPEGWNDVMYTEWWTIDDIALAYGEDVAERLRDTGMALYGEDGFSSSAKDRFGTSESSYDNAQGTGGLADSVIRSVRVVDYQYRINSETNCFVDSVAGDIREIPPSWGEERIASYLQNNPNVSVTSKQRSRIRWTIVAGDEILYDEWSPYRHFTIVGYFPHFVRGKSMGPIENLIGSQDLLNKTTSQELHVVNTTANSGYKVKQGSLQNMTVEDLENNGAKTGLVIEVTGMDDVEKISPNQIPSGLDRLSYKAEEAIKSISGVTDYMTGNAREDVSAKAVKANQAGGSANLAHIQDNLNRTDHILAKLILTLIQDFYTQPRLVLTTSDPFTRKQEAMVVNEVDEATGAITNDLTLGEYAVVVSNQPDRDTFEETQYDQILSMRTEAGVQIPDEFMIRASRLHDKAEIIQMLVGDRDSPEAQERARIQAELEQRMQIAEVEAREAEVILSKAKAQETMARAQANIVELQKGGSVEDPGHSQEILKLQIEREKIAFDREKLQAEMEMKRYEADLRAATERYKTDTTAKAARETAQMQSAKEEEAIKADKVKQEADELTARAADYTAKTSGEGSQAKPAKPAKEPAKPAAKTKTPTPRKKQTEK